MTRFLKVKGIREISPPDLDGHVFRLSLDIGEVIGTEFVPAQSSDLDVTISGTLQAVWGIPDSQLASSTGSVAAATVVQRASQGVQNVFQPVSLTTFSAPPTPPTYRIAIPGSLIPILEPEQKPETTRGTSMQFSFLSDNISEIRDNINALSRSLLRENLLELHEERPLFDMYKEAKTAEDLSNRIQSLAGLATAVNKKIILSAFDGAKLSEFAKRHSVNEPSQLAPLVLLEELLTIYSDSKRAKAVCDVFKRLNDLRQGFPTHGDKVEKVLPAYDFFKLRYPVRDFPSAWDTILGRYFDAMKKFLEIVEEYRYNVANVG
jgi:hypothetical protein